MRVMLAMTLGLVAVPALADVLVPTRTIRAREIVTAEDLTVKAAEVPGALTRPEEAIGKEARLALYPGRPVRPGDLAPPAIVGRNDLVTLVFTRGGLRIVAEGRALDRAAAGESLRVMNLASRVTVIGRALADGTIEVQ